MKAGIEHLDDVIPNGAAGSEGFKVEIDQEIRSIARDKPQNLTKH